MSPHTFIGTQEMSAKRAPSTIVEVAIVKAEDNTAANSAANESEDDEEEEDGIAVCGRLKYLHRASIVPDSLLA